MNKKLFSKLAFASVLSVAVMFSPTVNVHANGGVANIEDVQSNTEFSNYFDAKWSQIEQSFSQKANNGTITNAAAVVEFTQLAKLLEEGYGFLKIQFGDPNFSEFNMENLTDRANLGTELYKLRQQESSTLSEILTIVNNYKALLK